MASAILAFAVSAISYAISAGQAQTHDALHEMRATSLAEAMLEEVVSLPYVDPQGALTIGPDAGESNRQAFDNCDDFDGYTEDLGEVADAEGVAYSSDYAAFSRTIDATYGSVNIAALGGAVAGLTVTVTVTDERGRSWQAIRFIAEEAE